MNVIDSFLNRITMYRLVLYYLAGLDGLAIIFSAFGWFPFTPFQLIFSTVFLLIACWVANRIFAAILKAHPNSESAYITALILALIVTPQMLSAANYILFLIVLAGAAMGSKYILALNKKHIFNPAAFAVAASFLLSGPAASWWVGGNLPLMAFVLVGGFLVVRKIQRFDLALTFMGAALLSGVLTHLNYNPLSTIDKMIFHTPLFFFAAIMITEPLTTPPTRPWRIEYGALVGILFSPAIHLGQYYSTPELALIAGNLFSWAVSPKHTYVLKLKKKEEVGDGIYDFTFTPKAGNMVHFLPGQYLEWTLAHSKTDGRGNRRYFTIASSPTEHELHLGVKFYDRSSSFKKRLLALQAGQTIVAGHLAGDFTMPRDTTEKLVFIGGGIGITPFRSMVKYLSDRAAGHPSPSPARRTHSPRGPRRDVILMYSNRSVNDIAYSDVFDEAAETMDMKTVYAITGRHPRDFEFKNEAPAYGTFYKGRITAALIEREVPDWRTRTFYISGTHAMTTGLQKTLAEMGVPRSRIKVDFFPGFA